MENKYGTFTEAQFEEYKKRLHKLIHYLLRYKDDENPILNSYFDLVQFKLIGLNQLLLSPPELVEIMALIESAKIEFNKAQCNNSYYRHAILDAHELIDKIGRC